MYNLVVNEWVKIFKQIGTYIMLALIVITVIASGALTMYFDNTMAKQEIDWRQQLEEENVMWNEQLSEEYFVPASVKKAASQYIAINEYRLEHDLPPAQKYNIWSFAIDSAGMTTFAGLFVIIIAAGIVANEFSWGTIKILLVKPFERWKFLAVKYIAIILFLLLTIAILYTSVLAIGGILFGSGEPGSNIHLAYVDGAVVEQNQMFHLIKTYFLNSIAVFFLATMAFMISAAFRASGLAIGISLFLLLMGGTITQLIASNFDWAKYILFANTNLSQYINGTPMIEGMTMSFSITMLVIYFIVFHALAYFFFTKRDVST